MAHTHKFTIGDFKCTVISDGLTESDQERLQELFNTVPPENFGPAFHALYGKGGMVKRSMSMLLVQTGERTVLIDTGVGITEGDPAIGKLLPGLQAVGVAPEEIDTVIITHTHGDHINGLTDEDGALTFSNANYIMHEAEWESTMGAGGTARADDDYAKSVYAKLAPIEEKLTLVKAGDDVIPGFTFMDAFGHSPGHIVVLLESKGENLLFLADTILFEIQLQRPDWCPRFDRDMTRSVPTRKAILKRAADAGWLTLTYHFPFPGVGYYKADGAGFAWEKA